MRVPRQRGDEHKIRRAPEPRLRLSLVPALAMLIDVVSLTASLGLTFLGLTFLGHTRVPSVSGTPPDSALALSGSVLVVGWFAMIAIMGGTESRCSPSA